MGIFNLNKMSPKIKGLIAYFDLTDWWISEFSEEERKHIIKIYQPLGFGILTKNLSAKKRNYLPGYTL
jgi:hypothetical protein